VGETASSFTPGESGDYAVIVTQGSCSDTSECYTVDYTGLDAEGQNQGVHVYPNPANHVLNIQLDQEHTRISLRVVNSMGQQVLMKKFDTLDQTRLDINRFHPGVYLLVIKSDQMDKIIRFIKD
jgi:hypothetical protein